MVLNLKRINNLQSFENFNYFDENFLCIWKMMTFVKD